ncbi:MAG: DUF294 nucleotidyltransferase-like domain-containing protein [Pseudomonadota bacterium]
MPPDPDQITAFLTSVHPYDALEPTEIEGWAARFKAREFPSDAPIYSLGEPLSGLFLIYRGEVETRDENDVQISILGPRNSFGERGLTRDGIAVTSARALSDTVLLELPKTEFHRLIETEPQAARFFNRNRVPRDSSKDLAAIRVEDLMTRDPRSLPPEATVREAAIVMAEAHISSVCITRGDTLEGITTVRDLSGKVVAFGLPGTTPLVQVMTRDPITLPPRAIGSDVLHMMVEQRIGHVPIVEQGRLIGIVTQTDLTRFQAISSAVLIADLASAKTVEDFAAVTARIPDLLVQLVASGSRHESVIRLITDVADTLTRRLLSMAEARLGPPPVPYLWLACGSQGRQEQTGVSDQDNCLILDDAVTDADMPYFSELAQQVCAGLDACGYVFCPGDMMASNPRWCQPLHVWRSYFQGWIARPDPQAQMLASVMFDLRPIGGASHLFDDLKRDTLEAASRNSIFVAHMIANSLKNAPPRGLLRGLATIRSGEYKNRLDLKHNGVVPIVDLGRIYTLRGQLSSVNTRVRIKDAMATDLLSQSGGRDLLDAYDTIAEMRLEHQARQITAAERPDNYLAPSDLSDFERSHLRDAFVVVKSLQSALGHGRAGLS